MNSRSLVSNILTSMLYWEKDGKNSSSTAQGSGTRKHVHNQALLTQAFPCLHANFHDEEGEKSAAQFYAKKQEGRVDVSAWAWSRAQVGSMGAC